MQESKPAVKNNAGIKKTVSAHKTATAKKNMPMGTVVCIVVIIAVIGFFVMVYFNIGGLKNTAAELLALDVPAAADAALAEQQIQQAQDERAAIEQKERELNKKEDALADLDEELAAKEEAINAAIEQHASEEAQAKAEQEELLAAALIFEQMDAGNAAEAISGLETAQEMAQLLMNMASEKAAEILDEMDSELASEIASAMMPQ